MKRCNEVLDKALKTTTLVDANDGGLKELFESPLATLKHIYQCLNMAATGDSPDLQLPDASKHEEHNVLLVAFKATAGVADQFDTVG